MTHNKWNGETPAPTMTLQPTFTNLFHPCIEPPFGPMIYLVAQLKFI